MADRPGEILNVDDDAESREVRTAYLKRAGYVVAEAATGAHAVAQAALHPPDLVLLDVNLPDIAGYDVCRRIKAHPGCGGTAVILFSGALLDRAHALEGFEAGADLHLRMPLDSEELLRFVAAAVRRQRTTHVAAADREVMQHDLGRAALRYREMFDEAPYGILRARADGHLLAANSAFASLVAAGDIPGALHINARWLCQDACDWDNLVEEWRAAPAPGRANECEWQLPTGKTAQVRLSGRRLDDIDGEVFEVFVEDLTERRRLEMESLQGQKMEAVGRLAGGVAHDLNNWLTVVAGNAELLVDDATDDAQRHGLNQIIAAARSAADITRQLLAFSRKQMFHLQVLDLNMVVAGILPMLRRLIGEHIEIKLDLAHSVLAVRADSAQLQQVIVNLAVNARDAMAGGGRLTVRTAAVRLSVEDPPIAGTVAGPYVQLIVSDSGAGMPPDVRARVFEPFFTTKEQGKGTGLGMATVYGIVAQLNGSIVVDSHPGRGSAFKLYFPQTDEAVPVPVAIPVRTPSDTSHERILLVEDEESVRELAEKVLRRAGYEVTAAGGPTEGMEAWLQHDFDVDLVLTDVVMPGMSGIEMVAHMREQRPALRALLMSGYPDRLGTVGLSADDPLMPKPFTPSLLLERVRAALGRAA